MEVDVTETNNVKIITLQGDMNSETAEKVHNILNSHVVGSERVVLDMTDVTYMSSAGIRTLLLLYRSFKNNNGKVVLVGLSEDLQDTLSLTGFLEFFNTQPTLDDGIEALK